MVKKVSVNVSGKDLVKKVKEIVKKGKARRIRLIHKGRTLIDIPLTVGASVAVWAALAAPVMAALAAIAAMVKECTIEIEEVEGVEDMEHLECHSAGDEENY